MANGFQGWFAPEVDTSNRKQADAKIQVFRRLLLRRNADTNAVTPSTAQAMANGELLTATQSGSTPAAKVCIAVHATARGITKVPNARNSACPERCNLPK